jgi:hypothetical protein
VPLSEGSSKKTISNNIVEMREAGHPENQAVAAALSEARRSSGRRTTRRSSRKRKR